MSVALEPLPVDQASPAGGVLRAARRPDGWLATGPVPLIPGRLDELWPREDEDLCWLAGNWRILQRTDGHRTSLDDLLTAHLAVTLVEEESCPVGACLDLGCGIGSVLLFLAWKFPAARLCGIEAQEVSAAMARRSIAWNGVGDRATVVTDDLRSAEALKADRRYRLVTGTPPYFPMGAGPQSDHVQRAPCRFEHRGGIEDYCLAAAPVLAEGAPFVACQAWSQRERVEGAACAAGLRLVRWREVVPRQGKPPLLCIFAMRAAMHAEPLQTLPPLIVRDACSRRTSELVAIRSTMGMPP
jgi:tRNA1(Val) A37 N6-methylase TrmN6